MTKVISQIYANMNGYAVIVLFLCVLAGLSGSYGQGRKYLLFTDQNVERLKKQIKQDEEVAKAWNEQLNKAEELAAKDRWRIEDCQPLALAYRMTGEERFAATIKKIILNELSRANWEGGELGNRTPPWNAGLGAARRTFNAALGFDAIYNHVSKAERKEIAEGIVRLGINPILGDWLSPESSIHTFDTMGHNWWSSLVYTAGCAALVVRDEIPEAYRWVRQISETSSEWVNYSGSVLQNKIPGFDKDGGFYESINYAAFGVSEYLRFRYAAQHITPEIQQPELPVLEKTADFFLYMVYYVKNSKPLTVNFGDGNIHRNGNACVTLLYNMGFQKKRYAWYLRQTMPGDDREAVQLQTPIGLALHPDLPEIGADYVPDLPLSHLYGDMNWASLRDSWEPNATMLAIKSGFSWNHSHADAGSFILFHNGKYLIIDSGNSGYGHPLYTEYYCQSEAHNVILFDGKGQDRLDPYFGTVNHGGLHHLIEGRDIKYLLADATGPYAHLLRRNYRSFLWMGDVILVVDDLLAHRPGKFEWLLHYNGESERSGQDLSIRDGDAEIFIHPLFPETFPNGGLPHDFPEQMRLEEKIGYKDHHPEEEYPYWSISHFEETARTKLVNAILLKEEGNTLPKVERFEGANFIGVRITQSGKVTEVYFNLLADGRLKHRNSINVMNGWDTDAYLTTLTFKKGDDRTNPDNLQSMFIGHGSYLRRDGKALMHSLSKYYAEVSFEGQPSVAIDGQDNSKVGIRLPVKTGLRVNGQRVNHTLDKDSGLSIFVLVK